MRSRESEAGRKKRKGIIVLALLVFAIHFSLFAVVPASGKWQGVDESVVEKYAREHGREAVKPLIDTDHGDLLLFVFLTAGAIGGFACGYYWRMLTGEKDRKAEKKSRGPRRGPGGES